MMIHAGKFRGWFGLAVFALGGLAPVLGREVTEKQEDQVRLTNAHFRVERAALAPDGRHVAFVVRGGTGFEVQIHDTAEPGRKVDAQFSPLKVLDYIAWSSSGQLVIAGASIQVVDAATGRARELAEPADFLSPKVTGKGPPQLRVLGFAAGDPGALLVEVSVNFPEGEMSLELHRLDLATGAHQRTFARQLASPGGSLIPDRQGRARVVFSRDVGSRHFLYWPVGEKGAGKDLDDLLPDRALFAFTVAPATLLGERTIPLGFAADPEMLYFATNRGRDTYALQAVDLRTGRPTPLLAADPREDLVDFTAPWLAAPLVVDRARGTLAGLRLADGTATRWLDAEIATVQAALAGKFPQREVQVLEWDDARQVFLLLVSTLDNPGRYFVHDLRTGRSTEYFTRLPLLDPDLRNQTSLINVAVPSGGEMRVQFTRPPTTTTVAPPLVVWLHQGPWVRGPAGFNRDAQALATLGFAVLEPNYAGVAGEGRARRELVRQSHDRVPVDEVLAALDVLAARKEFDPARVVVVGEGYGGYLALRALQLHPERFRAGVAIEALTDLADLWRTQSLRAAPKAAFMSAAREEMLGNEGSPGAAMAASMDADIQKNIAERVRNAEFDLQFAQWVIDGGPPLAASAVTPRAAELTRPLLLMHDPNSRLAPFASIIELRAALKKTGRPASYFQLSPRVTRTELILRAGEFIREQTAAAP